MTVRTSPGRMRSIRDRRNRGVSAGQQGPPTNRAGSASWGTGRASASHSRRRGRVGRRSRARFVYLERNRSTPVAAPGPIVLTVRETHTSNLIGPVSCWNVHLANAGAAEVCLAHGTGRNGLLHRREVLQGRPATSPRRPARSPAGLPPPCEISSDRSTYGTSMMWPAPSLMMWRYGNAKSMGFEPIHRELAVDDARRLRVVGPRDDQHRPVDLLDLDDRRLDGRVGLHLRDDRGDGRPVVRSGRHGIAERLCHRPSSPNGTTNGTGLPLKLKLELARRRPRSTVGGATAITVLISGYSRRPASRPGRRANRRTCRSASGIHARLRLQPVDRLAEILQRELGRPARRSERAVDRRRVVEVRQRQDGIAVRRRGSSAVGSAGRRELPDSTITAGNGPVTGGHVELAEDAALRDLRHRHVR